MGLFRNATAAPSAPCEGTETGEAIHLRGLQAPLVPADMAGDAHNLPHLRSSADDAAKPDGPQPGVLTEREQIDAFTSFQRYEQKHPAGGIHCRVCRLPEVELVNQLLRDGKPVSQVARWLSAPPPDGRGHRITKNSLYRHKQGGHDDRPL